MTYVMVDIEADGPIPGDYSMVCFGAVIVEPGLERSFYGRLRPISERFVPEALAVSGFSRAEVLQFDDPREVMLQFEGGCAPVRAAGWSSSPTTTASTGSSSTGTSTTSSARTRSASAR
jgi:hypothetical protein